MAKTKPQEAGAMYYEAMRAVKNGGDSLWLLALHIKQMVNGTDEYPGPLWQVRELEPDGRIVELERFSDYLFLPPREGLGIPGFLFLDNVMQASKSGPEALTILRREIPDYDEQLDKDKRKHGVAKGRATDLPIKGGDFKSEEYKSKLHCNLDTQIKLSNKGNSQDYLLARLARDHPEILDGYERGDYPSVRQAAIAAGIVKLLPPLESVKKAITKLSSDDLDALKVWIKDK